MGKRIKNEGVREFAIHVLSLAVTHSKTQEELEYSYKMGANLVRKYARQSTEIK